MRERRFRFHHPPAEKVLLFPGLNIDDKQISFSLDFNSPDPDSSEDMNGLERFIGVVLDGKYHLERLLGQGGMGAVYLAIPLGTERPVALKLIAPEFMRNEEFIERFKRE